MSDGKPAAKAERCKPTQGDLALPVVQLDPQTGMKHSSAGKRRAYVLGAIHVFMLAHIAHWVWAGKTLSPIEPSESVEFFRYGIVNPGLIFFAVTILATMIFGRYVCGWGCHLVAYQDLMLWVLKKFNLRPKAFRSRFLVLVPLVIAAGWMFLVPTGYRLWLTIQGEPFPPIEAHFTKISYWSTFARLIFGAATILICGFAIIYFMGPKAFCTFACPYGAFFSLADRVAPYRIRVNDNCEQCGHCTAACTSNVAVSEEVNLYGMVVDPGCMKCLDCVQVCPNDALSVSAGRLPFGMKPAREPKPRRYDLSMPMEVVALMVFMISLMTINGLYGQFPFLMSLGVAAVVTFLLMKGISLVTSKTVMLQRTPLKSNGRWKPAGIAYGLITLALTALVGHSALWRYHAVRSNYPDMKIGNMFLNSGMEARQPGPYARWYADASYAGQITDKQRKDIDVAIHHLSRCIALGLFPNPDHRRRLAWLYASTDQREKAVEQMRAGVDELRGYLDYPKQPEPQIQYLVLLAQYEAAVGNTEAAEAAWKKALSMTTDVRDRFQQKLKDEPHPLSGYVWTEYGNYQITRGQIGAATETLREGITYHPCATEAIAMLGDIAGQTEGVDRQRRMLIEAARRCELDGNLVAGLARIRVAPQNAGAAVDDYRELLQEEQQYPVVRHNLAAAWTAQQQLERAAETYKQLLQEHPDYTAGRFDYGAVLFVMQDFERAAGQFEAVLDQFPTNAEAAFRLGVTYLQMGRKEDAMKAFEITREHGNAQQQAMLDSVLASERD